MADRLDVFPKEDRGRSFPKGISGEGGGAVCAQSDSDTLFLPEVGNPFGFHWVYGRGLLFFYCSGPGGGKQVYGKSEDSISL